MTKPTGLKLGDCMAVAGCIHLCAGSRYRLPLTLCHLSKKGIVSCPSRAI